VEQLKEKLIIKEEKLEKWKETLKITGIKRIHSSL
jgi:hypothetical protein